MSTNEPPDPTSASIATPIPTPTSTHDPASTSTSTTSPANPAHHRGLLIVIEGLDRSGKTTQTTNLATLLPQHLNLRTVLQKYPDRTTATGQIINSYLTCTTSTNTSTTLSNQAIHLLFSANRWESSAHLLSLLNSGTTVVVDRYSFSGAVYSAAKHDPTLSLRWAWNCEIGLPRPDLVVFLDVPESVVENRGGFGGERYENVLMQRRVRELFGTIFDLVPDLNVVRVDAGKGVDVVQDEVLRVAADRLEELRGRDGGIGEIGKLGALLER